MVDKSIAAWAFVYPNGSSKCCRGLVRTILGGRIHNGQPRRHGKSRILVLVTILLSRLRVGRCSIPLVLYLAFVQRGFGPQTTPIITQRPQTNSMPVQTSAIRYLDPMAILAS